MTPQERQLVSDLFDRLAQLENSPRDTDAERAIADGARRAPNRLSCPSGRRSRRGPRDRFAGSQYRS